MTMAQVPYSTGSYVDHCNTFRLVFLISAEQYLSWRLDCLAWPSRCTSVPSSWCLRSCSLPFKLIIKVLELNVLGYTEWRWIPWPMHLIVHIIYIFIWVWLHRLLKWRSDSYRDPTKWRDTSKRSQATFSSATNLDSVSFSTTFFHFSKTKVWLNLKARSTF